MAEKVFLLDEPQMTNLPERAAVGRMGRSLALFAGGSYQFEFTVGRVEVWVIRGVGTGPWGWVTG